MSSSGLAAILVALLVWLAMAAAVVAVAYWVVRLAVRHELDRRERRPQPPPGPATP